MIFVISRIDVTQMIIIVYKQDSSPGIRNTGGNIITQSFRHAVTGKEGIWLVGSGVTVYSFVSRVTLFRVLCKVHVIIWIVVKILNVHVWKIQQIHQGVASQSRVSWSQCLNLTRCRLETVSKFLNLAEEEHKYDINFDLHHNYVLSSGYDI